MGPIVIRKQIEIAASPTEVWRYVGTATGLREWWDVEVEMQELEGGDFLERGEEDGRPYSRVGEVLTYDPPHRLMISIHDAGRHAVWPERTTIEIRLEADGPSTIVTVIHRAPTVESTAVANISVTTDMVLPTTRYYKDGRGPTMELPNAVGPAIPTMNLARQRAMETTPLTLEMLYRWQSQQEEQWHCQLARLETIMMTH